MQRFAALLVAGLLGGCIGGADAEDASWEAGVVSSLALSEESLDFTAIGATRLLRATALTADGRPLRSARIQWSSTDPSVASVDGSGLVTALARGSADIVASHRGIAAKAHVRILPTPQDLAGIAILPEEPRLTFLGQAIQLRALGVDAEGDLLSEILASWEVEDASVARVDRLGVLEAVALGTTTVRATVFDGSLSTETRITVRPLPSSLAFLDAPAPTLAGAPQPGPIRVEARDAGGRRVRTEGLSVTLAATRGDERHPVATAPLVDGLATFDGLIVTKAGEAIRLEARHEPAVALSEPFRVTHAAPERLGFVDPPHPIEARVPFALRVGITDAYGNPVPSEEAEIRLGLRRVDPPERAVTGGGLASTEGGIATFELSIDGPGELTFEAEAPGWPDALSEPLRAHHAFTTLEAGGRHGCGLLRTGEVLCFGANESGQLGLPPGEGGDGLARPTLPGLSFLEIETGGAYSCGITAAGEALCWGEVPGREEASASPASIPLGAGVPVAIAAGADHLCLLLEGGGLRCLGENAHGQLGDGSRDASDRPVDVEAPAAVAIAAGDGFSCALAADGIPWCWGKNDVGQLGGASGADHEAAPIPLEGPALASLSLGARHACGLTVEGRAHCWGEAASGQLGDDGLDPSPTPREVSGGRSFVELDAGDAHSCAIDAGGRLLCWGAGADGQLGGPAPADGVAASPRPVEPPAEGLRFVRVSAGARHGCAIAEGGASYCWGRGADGRLGTGDTEDRPAPAPVIGTEP